MKKLFLSLSVLMLSAPLIAQTGFGSGIGTAPATGTSLGTVGAPTAASPGLDANAETSYSTNAGGFGSATSDQQQQQAGGFGTQTQPNNGFDSTFNNQQRMEDTTNPGGGLGSGSGSSTAPGSGTSFGTGNQTGTGFGSGAGQGSSTGFGTGAGTGTGTTISP